MAKKETNPMEEEIAETILPLLTVEDEDRIAKDKLTLSNSCKVTQNLGKCNCQPTDDVKAFVRKWERNVLKKNRDEFAEKASKKA